MSENEKIVWTEAALNVRESGRLLELNVAYRRIVSAANASEAGDHAHQYWESVRQDAWQLLIFAAAGTKVFSDAVVAIREAETRREPSS